MIESVTLAIVWRTAIFGVSLLCFVVVLDLARYIGQTLTYHRLLKDGIPDETLGRIRPAVNFRYFKQGLRSDLVLVGFSLLANHYYRHLESLPWMLAALPFLFLVALCGTYATTAKSFAIGKTTEMQ